MMYLEPRWNDIDRAKPKNSEKTLPDCHFVNHKSRLGCERTATNRLNSGLGGVVVNVLATGPKDCGLETGHGDGFLRAIKICSTPSLGWEVKILRRVKDLLKSCGNG
jgi:hypothetical protein